ncbi:MAG: hypothetical protein IPO21_12455 [Bacteroidales bacterium]|nr:hypothetical protein [Bacteroidales bacterium]
MIHIATVHWKTNLWLALQIKYLKKNINEPFQLYAYIDAQLPNQEILSELHYFSIEDKGKHEDKLNALSSIILQDAVNDSDYIMFLDGDAFPIAPLPSNYFSLLETHKLIAVKRLENNGDIQPHPCFTLTTVAFWKKLNIGWQSGYKWRNSDDVLVSDVGGNLLERLIALNVSWHALYRTNRLNLHPLLFGIYDNIIYHHGSGFRDSICGRIVRKNYGLEYEKQNILIKFLGYHIKNKYLIILRDKIIPFFRKNKQLKEEQTELKNQFMKKIIEDEYFYKTLM